METHLNPGRPTVASCEADRDRAAEQALEVYLNGRPLERSELRRLTAVLGFPIPAGRYWWDAAPDLAEIAA